MERLSVVPEPEDDERVVVDRTGGTGVQGPIGPGDDDEGRAFACGHCGARLLVGRLGPGVAPAHAEGEGPLIRCFGCGRYNEWPG